MKPKVFRYISIICLALAISNLQAQNTPVPPVKPVAPKPPVKGAVPAIDFKDLDIKLEKFIDLNLEKLDLAMNDLDISMNDLNISLNNSFENFENDFSKTFQGLEKDVQEGVSKIVNTVEKTKTISKSYSVSAKDKLAIDNQYGNVTINTWTKNEIKVDVVIKGFGSSADEANEFLEGVSINDSRESNLISFKTAISKNKSSWWGIKRKLGGEEKRGVQVNYQIYMPSKNALDISNKYGSTSVSNFDGVLNLNVSYGSLSAGALRNPANKIEVKYGSASIETLVSGSVDVAYGSLQIDNSETLNANIRYSSAKIGKLQHSGDIHLKYSGGFKIDEISSQLKDLNIDAAYSAVSLGFNPSSNFNFDVTVNYAGFKFDDNKVNITSKTPDDNAKGFNPSKNFKGNYGKGSNSNIIIKSNYGSVKFL